MRFKLFLILVPLNLYAFVSDDIALIQIASNTLSSVRELNKILTEQREFGKTFEEIYSTVDQGIWKADRTAVWLEDMKELSQSEIENIDDFNFVLAQLKDETKFLQRKLLIEFNKSKDTEKKIENAHKEEKKSKKRGLKYAVETKAKLSPQMAQVETAKNTKDLLLETNLLNKKISVLTNLIGKQTGLLQEIETRRIKQELEKRQKLGSLEKGILPPSRKHKK